MIRPELARYMLRNKGRNAALQQGGLARLTHDNLADLGVTPRPLEDEGPEETAAEGGVEESFHAPVAIAEAPQGQLDVHPQAALPGADPEELDAFPQPFSPAPMTQASAPVSAPRVDAESDDADELANARANDRTAAIARGFETAGRQLVAGISRTPILDTLTQQTNQVGEVRAAQKSRADKLRMAAEAARQSRETDDKLMNSESSRILDLARAAALSRDMRSMKDPVLENRRLSIEEKKAADATADRNRGFDLTEKKMGMAKPPKPPKIERGIPDGWEVNPASPPTEPMKGVFAKLVYDDHNIKGLTAKMKRLVDQASVRGRLDPTQNEEIKQTAGMLDMAVKEVPKLGALSGPDMAIIRAISVDPTNFASLVKDQGKLLTGIDDWMGLSVAAGEKAYGFRKRAAKPAAVVKGKSGKHFQQDANGDWEEVD